MRISPRQLVDSDRRHAPKIGAGGGPDHPAIGRKTEVRGNGGRPRNGGAWPSSVQLAGALLYAQLWQPNRAATSGSARAELRNVT